MIIIIISTCIKDVSFLTLLYQRNKTLQDVMLLMYYNGTEA